jgi:antitoxin ParD1/3/4
LQFQSPSITKIDKLRYRHHTIPNDGKEKTPMNVSLTPELETLIHEKVESGLYTSASEVVREALRLLRERDELQRQRLDQLRREIAVGLEQLDRGEATTYDDQSLKEHFEQIKAQGRKRLAAPKEKAA